MAEVELNQEPHPLLEAISNNDIEQVKELLRNVDDPKISRSALLTAVEKKNIDIARFLLTGHSAHEGEDQMNAISCALIQACWNVDRPMAELLLAHGADPYFVKGRFGYKEYPPIEVVLLILLQAEKESKLTADCRDILHLFLIVYNWKVDNIFFISGQLALFAAVMLGRVEKAMEILESGASTDSVMPEFSTSPFVQACKLRNIPLIKLFLEHGADPFIEQLFSKHCPMGEALCRSHIDTVELMTKFGDCCKSDDTRFMTTLAKYAVGDTDDEITDRWIDKQFNDAIQHENFMRVEMLLPYVQDIDKVINCTSSPLVLATEYARHGTGIIDMLIENGAALNPSPDVSYYTPLAIACLSNPSLVHYLLTKGADPNLSDRDGMTPLHHICDNTATLNMSKVDSVKDLLLYGADVNARSNTDQTPIEMLLTFEQYSVYGKGTVEMLVECACMLLIGGSTPYLQNVASSDDNSLVDYLVDMLDSCQEPGFAVPPNLLNMVEVMILTGLITRRDMVYLSKYLEEFDDQEFEKTKKYLKGFLENGYTLKEISRLKLRATIHSPLPKNVMSAEIEIPTTLKDYVLFGNTTQAKEQEAKELQERNEFLAQVITLFS